MRQFSLNIRRDAAVKLTISIEDMHGVFPHFPAVKKFRRRIGKVQPQLKPGTRNLKAQILIRQQQPALGKCRYTAGVEKPSWRTSGVYMEQNEQFLFDVPQLTQPVFSDSQGLKYTTLRKSAK